MDHYYTSSAGDRDLLCLELSAKGSIMRHTRPDDAAPHDHRSVAPRFVEAGVRLVRGEKPCTQSLMSRKWWR